MVNARLERPCECGAKYKIILMDINMPEIDGFLATEIIIEAH
jgi:CheY-like chemotaxis protein